MSQAKQCPFVLAFDAIASIKDVLDKLAEKDYYAAPDSDHKHFRPELHAPVQLIAYAAKNTPANVSNGQRQAIADIQKILCDKAFERAATKDGDMSFGLKNPFVRLVFDSDHGIIWDPTIYGPELIPTQLVLAHALRLNNLFTDTHRTSATTSTQCYAHGKLNITIVTHYPATIAIALAEGYQVWDYAATPAIAKPATTLENLLMKNSLVERDYSVSPPTPKLYKEGRTPAEPLATEQIT